MAVLSRSPALAGLLSFAFVASLPAQTTWVVDALNRPGAHFTDIPAAEAAASPGDTIQVRGQVMGLRYTPFATSKGITVVGLGTPAPSIASTPPVTVTNIPSGQTFSLVNFEVQRGRQLRFDASNCQGRIHLENLSAVEPGPMFPFGTASITLQSCAFVSLLDVDAFGDPVVDVTASTVQLTACTLGITSIGIGGGTGILARRSVVSVIEPSFDAGFPGAGPAIRLQHCILDVGGSPASYLQGAGGTGGSLATEAIRALASVLTIDPAVRLNPLRSANQNITGSFFLNSTSVPGTWIDRALPGGTLTMTHTAAPGTTLIALVGLPQEPPLIASIGTILVDPTAMATLAVTTVPASGMVTVNLAIPSAFGAGPSFAAQGALLDAGGVLSLTRGCPFVVH